MDTYFGVLQPDGWVLENLPPLPYVSDFSGCDAIACALFALGVRIRYLFATETERAARKFLRLNHAPDRIYSDVAERLVELTKI